MIDIQQQQIPTREEKVVLETLALSVARQGCRFLEIGSWCGDSTIILGKIAQQNGGHLFCVDWWKGNVGTDLIKIASTEDVFSFFWKRISGEGLEDVVVPIRGRSEVAGEILKGQAFDLIFIDGDHRYEHVLRDIGQYSSLVRRNGILCGHDCEGRISDYATNFLDSGKDVDYYETVHCGVVLAVGSTFRDYSINHAIWSVRAGQESGAWEPTNLTFPGIEDRRQTKPPPIGYTKHHQVHRYGKLVYAVPRSLGFLDIAELEERTHPEIIRGATVQEVVDRLGEPLSSAGVPLLLETYQGYNLVKYEGCIFAFSQTLGPLDLTEVSGDDLKAYQENGKCVVGGSSDEAKRLVDQLLGLPTEKEMEEAEQREALERECTAQGGTTHNLSLQLKALERELRAREPRWDALERECQAQAETVRNLSLQLEEFKESSLRLTLKLALRDGWSSLQQSRLDEALGCFDSVVQYAGAVDKATLGEAHRGRGWAYYQKGRFEEAIEDFNKALDSTDSNHKAVVHHLLRGRSWAYYRIGKWDEAITHFNRAKVSPLRTQVAILVLTFQVLASRVKQRLKRACLMIRKRV